MADMIDNSKISFACELDKDLETPTTESNTEARITFTETQIVLGLGNDKSIKYKATGSGTDLSNYYNKSQVDEKLKLKADKTQLGNYYNKGEVDSALGNKVDTTTLTNDYYNKTKTDNLLSNKADTTALENYYNKSDIDGKLANKVDTTTLDSYDLSTVVDSKVEGVSNKIGDLSTLETGIKDNVVKAINEVKRAQTEAGRVTNLNDLGDVNASAPRRGQFLGWDQDTRKWVSKDIDTDGMDTHIADFNNPHRTTISNLNDTTITKPQSNQALVYDGTKWVNKSVSLDDSNYAKLDVTNTFTKPQIIPNATADTHAINKGQLDSGLGTKISKTGNETIAGTKTFSSPVVIPNATEDTHALNRVTADGRYAQLLTKNLTWLVGSGGDYEDLQTAINEASKYINFSDYTITIRLKNSLSLSDEIQIVKVNIPFVNLDFNGFSLNYGLVFYNSIFGKIIKANINSSRNCIYAKNNSEIILTDNITLNGYDGIISSEGSKVIYLNSSNNNNITINCQSGRYGIYANLGGKIEVQNSNIECNNGTALFTITGGIINANSIVITGTSTQSNISFNTFTNYGYILK